LDGEGIEDGVPFLISPDGHYDVDLNAYFLLHPAPENTLAATAYDLASFLTFLWHHRQPLGQRSWRDRLPRIGRLITGGDESMSVGRALRVPRGGVRSPR
jgi:hypothetical protein